MRQAMANNKICGDGPFTRRCDEWMEQRFHAGKVLLTTSGTTALEMAALLCGIQPGDEVILPSYTFSSTATAFVGGVQLTFLGFLGEYIMAMNARIMDRPLVVEEKRLNFESETPESDTTRAQ